MISASKTRILDAAEGLFASKGYAATSVVDIAEAIGIRGPAIYKHYASKADIYNAVIDRLFSPMRAHVEGLTRVEEVTSQELLERLVKHHIDHPNIPRLIQQATLNAGEHLDKLVDDWYRPFFSRVPTDGADATPLIMAFHSMLLGYITLAPLHQRIFKLEPLAKEEVAKQLALQVQLAAMIGAQTQAATAIGKDLTWFAATN